MTRRWRLLDSLQQVPHHIDPEKERCYYAREYVSGGGWKASEANRLITNFKKDPEKRGTPEWYHKERAIEQFAQELTIVLGANHVVAPIPSSKRLDDPGYDSRLDDTLKRLATLRSDVTCVNPFSVIASTEPYHLAGGIKSRDPKEIYRNLEWTGLPENVPHLILIDDVLTSGAHFVACKRLVQEHHPVLPVLGVFWAKTIWPLENEGE